MRHIFILILGIFWVILSLITQEIQSFAIAIGAIILGFTGFIFRNDQLLSKKWFKPITNVIFVLIFILGVINIFNRLASRIETIQPSSPVDSTEFITARSVKVNSKLNLLEEGVALVIKAKNNSGTINAEVQYPQKNQIWEFKANIDMKLSPEFRIPNENDVLVEIGVIAIPKGTTYETLDFFQSVFSEVASTYSPGESVLKGVSNIALSKVTNSAKDSMLKMRWIGYRQLLASQIGRDLYVASEGKEFELFWAIEKRNDSFVGIVPPAVFDNGNSNNKIALITTTQFITNIVYVVQNNFIISPTVLCPRSEECIKYPTNDVDLTASQPLITIIGTATRNNFSYYKFELESNKCPGNLCWLATYSNPVIDATLFTFDIRNYSQLDNGGYWIRMNVIDKFGNSYPEYARFHINVKR